jgi:hypothetical protein
VYFGIEELRGHIAVKAARRGFNEILSLGWLGHQPSNAFDDVSTPVFDRALEIVTPSDTLESV